MRIRFMNIIITVILAALVIPSAVFAQPDVFPDTIALPDGWSPEGIAIGPGHTFYSGSRVDGAIYRGDLRTGEGEIFVEGQAGRIAVGLKYDSRCDILVVAGGTTGQGYIYDADTGDTLQVYQFASSPTFINDVVVAKKTAYFTDSTNAQLYAVDLSDCNSLTGEFETIPLSGDWQQVSGFNANGIVAHPNGKTLIVVNSTTGTLYRVDPNTGFAEAIDVGSQSFSNGDGLLLRGQTLYVVRNFLNEIVAVRLDPDWSEGTVLETITDPAFDIPTTIARFGNALYAINGRFSTPLTPETPFNVVRVELNR